MSQENVELVQEMFAARKRGDVLWLKDRSEPEIVIVQPPEGPDAKTDPGHAGVIESLEDWPNQWDEFEVELIDVIDVDDDRVISVSRQQLKKISRLTKNSVISTRKRTDLRYASRRHVLLAAGCPQSRRAIGVGEVLAHPLRYSG